MQSHLSVSRPYNWISLTPPLSVSYYTRYSCSLLVATFYVFGDRPGCRFGNHGVTAVSYVSVCLGLVMLLRKRGRVASDSACCCCSDTTPSPSFHPPLPPSPFFLFFSVPISISPSSFSPSPSLLSMIRVCLHRYQNPLHP